MDKTLNYISRIEDIKKYLSNNGSNLVSFDGKAKSKVVFECSKCKKPAQLRYDHLINAENNPNLLCKDCLKEDRKKRTKETCLAKYGGIGFASKELSGKTNKVIFQKYGTTSYSKTEECKNKIKETSRKKYNGIGYASKLIKDKCNDTCLKKYGEENYCNREKARETYLEKYGAPYICMADVCQKANYNIISKINLYWKELFEKNDIPVEMEFKLENKSYDFHILDTNILIEINPTYTHQSSITFFGKKELLSKEYHLNKTILAKKNGYHCIHIWDWDDADKIINMLKPKQKLYAKNLFLKEISKKECDSFLNEYHLQGTCKNQIIRLGLYTKDNQLIQLMTFGKPRYNHKFQYELLRLCSHKDYKIVGGSERLFKYFIKKYNADSIISYCDNSKFSGGVYEKLGFILNNVNTQPSIHWYNGKQHITQSLLNQLGFDKLFGTNYGKGTNNRDLMLQHNFYEVYDAGQSTFSYINNKIEK